MLALLVLASFSLLYLGYRFYSSWIERNYNISPRETAPSREFYDGVDYVPTNKYVLLGHHFSSIAGAGPIVGPIIAAAAFGWLPALLWIILGSVFIGGVHDYSSLVISMRHKGKSIAEVANLYINKRTYRIFLVFIWLALMYVVAVFADITATTFAKEPAVSQISVAYILTALGMGYASRKFGTGLKTGTAAALSVILILSLLSVKFPFFAVGKTGWVWILMAYCVLASILPVWLLLQPRDYLSSYLLYASVAVGITGIFAGNFKITYPAALSFHSEVLGNLFPFLFITIACGAVSGFHSLVASGTTSKQIGKVGDGRMIGYGAMLLEAVVAVIALAIVMVSNPFSGSLSRPPAAVFAAGMGRLCSVFGLSPAAGSVFGFLVISAFMLTTLDTATRIARYVFQELAGIKGESLFSRSAATLASVILPVILLTMDIKDPSGTSVPCWKIIWPLFGITNQLLAALVLLIIFIWARKEEAKHSLFILLPAVFMGVMTVWALASNISASFRFGNFNLVFYIALALMTMSLWVIAESILSLFPGKRGGVR